jgi:hypothetical protein
MIGVLGIDPGLNGGIAVRGDELGSWAEPLPLIDGQLDIKELISMVKNIRTSFDKAYIEEVHSVFGSSARNTFQFGRICGQLEAVLTALEIPFEYVKPKVWQPVFFPIGGKLDPKQRKERCVLAARRLFPTFNFRPTERSKNPHLGMVDALLIAEYGWRKK